MIEAYRTWKRPAAPARPERKFPHYGYAITIALSLVVLFALAFALFAVNPPPSPVLFGHRLWGVRHAPLRLHPHR
jgi:hypothetical protein